MPLPTIDTKKKETRKAFDDLSKAISDSHDVSCSIKQDCKSKRDLFSNTDDDSLTPVYRRYEIVLEIWE